VFVREGATDLRLGFEGLYGLVEQQLKQDPLSGHLFVFCNRQRTRIKILTWDGSGLWLCTKEPVAILSHQRRSAPDYPSRGISGISATRCVAQGSPIHPQVLRKSGNECITRVYNAATPLEARRGSHRSCEEPSSIESVKSGERVRLQVETEEVVAFEMARRTLPAHGIRHQPAGARSRAAWPSFAAVPSRAINASATPSPVCASVAQVSVLSAPASGER
jgi:hypothetical protein